MKYSEWLNLSEEQRRKTADAWNPFEGDGVDLLNVAIERFRKEYAALLPFCTVTSAIYHGSVLGISVSFKRGIRPRGPKGSFEGFPIFRGHPIARRGDRVVSNQASRPAAVTGAASKPRRISEAPILGEGRRLRRKRTGSAG